MASSGPQGEGRARDGVGASICHRAIHANLSNGQLARMGADVAALRADPGIAAFLRWVANKPPDLHAPTRVRRG